MMQVDTSVWRRGESRCESTIENTKEFYVHSQLNILLMTLLITLFSVDSHSVLMMSAPPSMVPPCLQSNHAPSTVQANLNYPGSYHHHIQPPIFPPSLLAPSFPTLPCNAKHQL